VAVMNLLWMLGFIPELLSPVAVLAAALITFGAIQAGRHT